MPKPITFTLSDESIENSYGFYVNHAGIKTERFFKNPVMLDAHNNQNRSVLGKWTDPRFDGKLLKAESDFDIDDDNVKVIAGKVERGYIRGASIGLIFNPVHLAINKEGKLVLEQCELLEASICPVPSNGNSISLYNTKEELLTEAEVRQMCLSVTKRDNRIENNNEKKMEKIILSAAAVVALASLGVTNTEDAQAVSQGIEKLQTKLTAAEGAVVTANAATVALQAKLDAQLTTQIDALLQSSKLSGKILESEVEQYRTDLKANFELTSRMLAKIPATKSLSATVENTEVELSADDAKVKSIDDFQKLSLNAQLAFKKDHATTYAGFFAKG